MSRTYEQKKQKNHTALYTIVSILLIIAIFLAMTIFLFSQAEDDAYEMLYIQTKQIKDDLTLQIKSDRENLVTMANFAAKLYADGESYDLMFQSFKPIGLFANIGILNADNTFVTKVASIDLDGKISFAEEAARGAYISGRVPDLTRDGEEIIRSAVPIKVNGDTVGVLYGVIKLDTIGEKYNAMASELDAQLFVYDKETGKFVIDTIDTNPGEMSMFADREYNDGYSYEELRNSDKGYSSFVSKYTGEDLYIHYSTLEDFDWGIMLARYENQVFAETHEMLLYLLQVIVLIAVVLTAYIALLLRAEKNKTSLTSEASAIRHLLLDINQQHENIESALKRTKEFSRARSCFFTDNDGTDHYYVKPQLRNRCLQGADRTYFVGELFKYASDVHTDSLATEYMEIVPNKHLFKTNPDFCRFMKAHDIHSVAFVILSDKRNLVSLLGTINPRKSSAVRSLIEDIAVCFAIAIYNKKHLNHTEHVATTDALTGASNRVAYNKDIVAFDQEKPADFSCIYVDVNELHIRNNKYGHAAGDEMLLYIANTLKEVFYGHRIYRMGGDEYLVFVQGVDMETVRHRIAAFREQLKPRDYHVAVGMSYRSQNTGCDEMVREAEIRMYEEKARYYQDKEQQNSAGEKGDAYVCTQTGIKEIDTLLSVMKDHYNGIYRVSLDTDSAGRILMPSYLGYNENEENFSKLVKKYVENSVHPDYHRSVLNFINYDALRRQLAEGNIPTVSYKKWGGEDVILSVYNLSDDTASSGETLWVFAKN